MPFALLHTLHISSRVNHSSGYQLSQLPLRDEPITLLLFPSTFISAAPSAKLKILHQELPNHTPLVLGCIPQTFIAKESTWVE
jgi:hypothetical protein